jgi:ABC transporter
MTGMQGLPGGALPEPTAVDTGALTKHYGKVSALTDCTISVPEGRISALIGPNGAGKTTLLRLLAGLAGPTSGQAMVNGTTPRQDPAFLSHAVGFLIISTLGAPVLVGLFWGSPRGRLPDHLDAGRAGPGRAVLGRPAGSGRGRGRHHQVCLDAEHHPQALDRGQDRLDAAGRGDLGRRHRPW